MASKRRIRRNACGRKRKYATEQLAKRAIGELARAAGPIGYLRPYKCSFCGQYHFGHVLSKV
jgi:hypothetical protein